MKFILARITEYSLTFVFKLYRKTGPKQSKTPSRRLTRTRKTEFMIPHLVKLTIGAIALLSSTRSINS